MLAPPALPGLAHGFKADFVVAENPRAVRQRTRAIQRRKSQIRAPNDLSEREDRPRIQLVGQIGERSDPAGDTTPYIARDFDQIDEHCARGRQVACARAVK